MRIGTGYDVHKLVKGRELIIGCVDIPYEFGLLGHSDADVLAHAIIDALFGAAYLSDIGTNFPDTDEKYKDISGSELLIAANKKIIAAGYRIINIDSVVIAQKPKLMPYIPLMQKKIAEALNIESSLVSVKAKTEEGLGFTGAELGIAAQATALLMKV
ncbi:MAG: 2-C-methyl-D-erythritol 2,4-cyclodiphosphate synthase [Oscillospiraceae bacterium]|nr:2-C-methyl-D-erythritol 2,4-cyclodiphosphate synthase [Oscillospiraceae bacterium]